MLAELTYRCPLHCGYCSNPVELAAYRAELTTEQWCAAITRARALGVLQLHLSGGEPLVRGDLVELVACGAQAGCYVNLVTSGLGLTRARMAALAEAGLAHVQLSVQDGTPESADRIAGTRAFHRKLAAAELVRAHQLPLTVNAVLHRGNADHVDRIAELAARLGAERLELAHTQYYGWALRNRAALLPTPAQVALAAEQVARARQRWGGVMDIVHVVADYYESQPKPCMNGWGRRQFTVAPNGDVLPCPAAAQIPGLGIENVTRRDLADIWWSGPAFERFRGTDWMRDPCRGCVRRDVDFGGCRCQAFQLLGDAAATDPVCQLSPHHDLVRQLLAPATQPAIQPLPRPSR
ncbi:pyrroloquinoline quinone biosynthesis protein PqqE [Goodfellowiella coeruleoviolacea]|nr:pyrroloquinoline quinone biosynthesis protein PqqE [Goodfellowiella coeruleoviolacea]